MMHHPNPVIKTKMSQACNQVVALAMQHRECDRYDEPNFREWERTYDDGTKRYAVEAIVRFNKYGSEILRVPPQLDDGDYDWPILTKTGSQWLNSLGTQATTHQELVLDHPVSFNITNIEKGWPALGYFYTTPHGTADQTDAEA